MKGQCEICGVDANLTKHHLIPKTKCHNKYKEIKDTPENLVWLCPLCHNTIHAYFSEATLKDRLHTLEDLLSESKFAAYVKWRKKHPNMTNAPTVRSADW